MITIINSHFFILEETDIILIIFLYIYSIVPTYTIAMWCTSMELTIVLILTVHLQTITKYGNKWGHIARIKIGPPPLCCWHHRTPPPMGLSLLIFFPCFSFLVGKKASISLKHAPYPQFSTLHQWGGRSHHRSWVPIRASQGQTKSHLCTDQDYELLILYDIELFFLLYWNILTLQWENWFISLYKKYGGAIRYTVWCNLAVDPSMAGCSGTAS